MATLIEVLSANRSTPDADWPVLFTITAVFDDGDGQPEEAQFGYYPDDPYGTLNPDIAGWLHLHPEFEIDPYVAPPDPVPSDFTLTKHQINAALIVSGKTTDPNGFVTGIISAIADPVQQALALNDWQNAPFYKRDHQLFNDPDLLAEANMTSADIDALWMVAKDLPS